MIGKVINGRVVEPSANERKKIIITNPTDEILKTVMGYKDMVVDEEPAYDNETQYIEKIPEETDNLITVHWEIRDIEEPTE